VIAMAPLLANIRRMSRRIRKLCHPERSRTASPSEPSRAVEGSLHHLMLPQARALPLVFFYS
jgi:hypothetical protein